MVFWWTDEIYFLIVIVFNRTLPVWLFKTNGSWIHVYRRYLTPIFSKKIIGTPSSKSFIYKKDAIWGWLIFPCNVGNRNTLSFLQNVSKMLKTSNSLMDPKRFEVNFWLTTQLVQVTWTSTRMRVSPVSPSIKEESMVVHQPLDGVSSTGWKISSMKHRTCPWSVSPLDGEEKPSLSK